MSDGSKIGWTNATWNPITGCSVESPGCANCYAMLLAATRLRNHPSREGLARMHNGHAQWTGEVRFNSEWLDQPLRWKRPRMIFVVAHGDLFHPKVPVSWIKEVFAVMALAPQHTFQVLTKRPARARRFLAFEMQKGMIWAVAKLRFGRCPETDAWPLPNVWIGTSVEDQKRADERVPFLLDTPAAVRWVSAEPLLGPTLLWTPWILEAAQELSGKHELPGLDWTVVGCESGPDARPFDLEWARGMKRQSQLARSAFFLKQIPGERHGSVLHKLEDFPPDLRVQAYPGV